MIQFSRENRWLLVRRSEHRNGGEERASLGRAVFSGLGLLYRVFSSSGRPESGTGRLCAPHVALGLWSPCTVGGGGAGSGTQNLPRVGKARYHVAACTAIHLC